MNIIKSIQEIFHSKSFTKAALQLTSLIEVAKRNENNSAYIIELNQSNITANFTIPNDVFEIYIELKIDNTIITRWDDFYGNSKESDYIKKLSQIKDLIDNKTKISIRNNEVYLHNNTIEELWF